MADAPTAEVVAALRADLLSAVGTAGLLEPEDFETRSCDPFRPVPILSPFVARPANAEELSAVVKAAIAHGFRIVTHGGRTGVAGGAFTRPDSIVVSLERMNRIEEISDVDQIAVVQAGVPIQALHEAVEARGLFYPVDLGAKGSATMGGTIATNAGGNHVLRWGMTRANLLGIEGVLADGTIVSSMNRLLKNNTGYDLKHLFAGTEGTIGIVTRAVVRLVPLPTTQSVAFVAVESMAKVLRLLNLARAMPALSAFEVMWRDYYEMVANSGTGRRPLEPGHDYHVLIESLGNDPEADEGAFERFVQRASDEGLIADGVVAASERQRRELWHVREASEVFVSEFGTFVSFDVSAELNAIERMVEEAYAALRARFPEVRGGTFGHLGDNNIHLGITIGEDTVARTAEIEEIVFDVLARYQGALTAEHGIGTLKRDFLRKYKSEGELAAMRRLRDAFDPDRRLNPDVML
ncbi:FAD-binding oxidoreductase [Rhizorhabdus wittichii DC-6]|uniref:FAD linked oxidase domain protein n=1 Tax=Rhizorhabdus wittichii (strain DSM 6014 / CCUG 31198 / JCM 15750 / NBRC 105917 / EY 4224 / RW1) TaxID=392499 RepID=A0A9J9HBE3_RHIWR|nr:FAD linked oxidase domain protein [Rhizorhabdus wittichii RW1]ARR54753.1 FAD-binding oxidoreductase [Rhizorhabdus wittichii DC-6]